MPLPQCSKSVLASSYASTKLGLNCDEKDCVPCVQVTLLAHFHLEKQISASPDFLQVHLILQSNEDYTLYL